MPPNEAIAEVELAVFPRIKPHGVIVFLSVLVLAVVVCVGVVGFCMRKVANVRHDMLIVREQHRILDNTVAALPPPPETANVITLQDNPLEDFAANMSSANVTEAVEWTSTRTSTSFPLWKNRSSSQGLLENLVVADGFQNRTL